MAKTISQEEENLYYSTVLVQLDLEPISIFWYVAGIVWSPACSQAEESSFGGRGVRNFIVFFAETGKIGWVS